MKKIGIITMHRVINFGSILQAYALQTVINNMGNDCELIDYVYPNDYHLNSSNRSFKNIKLIRYVYKFLIGKYKVERDVTIKKKKFHKFFSRYINTSDLTFSSKEELLESNLDYNVFITGSDQVWNPYFLKKDTSFLLPFVKNKAIKISYSSSFASEELDTECASLYAPLLKMYKAISVREDKGVKIVNDLIRKEAKVTLDPTLLLREGDWDKLIEYDIKRKPYLFAYILIYANDPGEYIYSLIEKIAKDKNLDVILCGAISDKARKKYKVVDDIGPSEYLSYFKNASYVVTTSFHGTAFSVNFGKQFVSVIKDINSGDNRILSLLRQLGVESQGVSVGIDYKDLNLDYNIDMMKNNLNKLRKQSIDFLDNAIKLETVNE